MARSSAGINLLGRVVLGVLRHRTAKANIEARAKLQGERLKASADARAQRVQSKLAKGIDKELSKSAAPQHLSRRNEYMRIGKETTSINHEYAMTMGKNKQGRTASDDGSSLSYELNPVSAEHPKGISPEGQRWLKQKRADKTV